METSAVILHRPRELSVETVRLGPLGPGDAVVEISHSGISTGTEKLLWSGAMPPFPGMGYPLVPGYEAIGNVVETGRDCALKTGDRVFVPGANCFGEIRGLFGAAAAHVVTGGERLVKLDPATGPEGALLALAATAHHALALHTLPDLIVGHGTLGRLLARLAMIGGAEPTVWETDPARRSGDHAYSVCDPDADVRKDYRCIYDASGDTGLLDALIGRLAKGGEIVLAGFYAGRVNFAFPMAFMKEARLRVAAEWGPDDMTATAALLHSGRLRLDDLITHDAPANDAEGAYRTAFTDAGCLKMILDWKGTA